MKKIYMLNISDLESLIPNFNQFTLSDLNDFDKLPPEILYLMDEAKTLDMVYTIDNFALDFNLMDELTNRENYMMFVPNQKFNL